MTREKIGQMKLSILDLSNVPEGSAPKDALRNSIDLARHVENLGFKRIWYAEHHNMTGIASAATAVLIGQVAAVTNKIILGSGGIMLPNHSPLVIAEQFGTLSALYPGRIELGLGRAPGTDQLTARALRHRHDLDANSFPQDVVELLGYFKEASQGQQVRAVPGAGENVPIWILGSSLFGAQLAAILGLPYAFASHFAPAELDNALKIYRERFEPSETLTKPHAMVALNAIVADSDEEAQYLFTSLQQSFVNLRTGRAGPLPRPQDNFVKTLPEQFQMILEQTLSCSVIGSPQTVREGLTKLLAHTKADELIVTTTVHDHEARKKSFTLLSEIMETL